MTQMNSAMFYLLRTRLKNNIKSLLHTPAKLIYVIFMAAMLALCVVSGGMSAGETETVRPISEVSAMLCALLILMFCLVINGGFTNGGSMFKLPDVNLLFTAPVKPSKVLFYGMSQQLGLSFLLAFFMLFQYSWLKSAYGVGFGVILLLIVGYAVTVFAAQLTAMVIYSFSSSAKDESNRQKNILRTIFYVFIAAYAAYFVFALYKGRGDLLVTASGLLTSLPLKLFPVAGWMSAAVGGILTGEYLWTAVGLLLTAAYITVLALLVSFSGREYYEDVIKTAEITHSAITAQKEGQVAEAVPKNVKVGKTGLGGGNGASAFYYKHKLEKRRSRVFILGGTELIFCAVTVIASVFMRSGGPGMFSAAFGVFVYTGIFSSMLGRVTRELTKPYVYMLPEPSFTKLLQCLRESLSGFVLQALLALVPAGLILGAESATIITAVLAGISYLILYTAGNIVIQRIFGSVSSRILTMALYLLIMIVLALPGGVAAILISVAGLLVGLGSSTAAAVFATLALSNILVSALVIFLCRNIFEYSEYN